MGMFDNLKKKATKAVDDHGGQIAKGIDKAAAMADKKTKGKYHDKIATGTAKAKDGGLIVIESALSGAFK